MLEAKIVTEEDRCELLDGALFEMSGEASRRGRSPSRTWRWST
jgi:hypothetical protein